MAVPPAGCGLSRSFIFAPGGDAATDVPLSFVQVQDLLDLQVQRPVKGRKPLGQILCTVDLLMPNCFAAARTVAWCSMMYRARSQARSSISVRKFHHSQHCPCHHCMRGAGRIRPAGRKKPRLRPMKLPGKSGAEDRTDGGSSGLHVAAQKAGNGLGQLVFRLAHGHVVLLAQKATQPSTSPSERMGAAVEIT